MKLRVGLLFASCLLLAAGFRFDAAADWKELKGDWQATKMELDGNALPADEVKEFVITMSEGKYVAKRGDQTIDEGTSKIDGSKSPKHLDLVASEGENKDKLRKGIYELKDGTLKLVVAAAEKDRPTKLESGSGLIYIECTKKK